MSTTPCNRLSVNTNVHVYRLFYLMPIIYQLIN